MLRNFRIVLRPLNTKYSTKTKIKDYNVVEEDKNMKLLKVAVIGVPNVGKSTFINNLMDRKVCPTSKKVHTTRAKMQAVFTEGDSQIVFLDTPGLVSLKEYKKFNLEKSFLKDSKNSLQQADLIGVVHDASNVWTRHKLDLKIIRLLEENQNKPSFLIFNKIDIIKSKRKLLDLTRLITENCIDGKPITDSKPLKKENEIRGWPHFKEIFMISALSGDGLSEVKNYLIKNAKPSPWLFPPDAYSDATSQEIIVKTAKAKLLDFLPQEMPYNLKTELEYFEINSKGVITAVILVHCPNERISKFVAGDSDGKLRQITASVQDDLQQAFQNFVKVKIVLNAPKE